MTIYWTVVLVGFVVLFVIGESYALARKKQTLSRFVWILTKKWPPLPFFAGFAAGFLACHFWWGGIVCFASP